ncbi:hypothetical protein SLA2020_109440 [Shorea laevis]
MNLASGAINISTETFPTPYFALVSSFVSLSGSAESFSRAVPLQIPLRLSPKGSTAIERNGAYIHKAF